VTVLAVVVPTYNEQANVGELVRRLEASLAGRDWEVIFVDDDSPDGTAATLRVLTQRNPRVRVLQRIGRRGLSRAVVEGVLSTSAPVIAVMDADLQHDETILPAMLRKLESEDLDIVVGSRYAAGGSTGALDLTRVRMSRLATRLAGLFVRTGLTDPMSGFFVLRRGVFEEAMRRLSGEGYKLLLDLLASAPRRLRLAEVPYTFRPRVAGESKLDSAVIWEFGLLLLDKTFQPWIPARFVLFSLVGASGLAVHFAVLWLAYRVLAIDFGVAQAIATMNAMTSNYALNNWLTYRDRRHRGMGWLGGLLSFYVICGLGVVANVGVATALFAPSGWILAAAAGALVGTVWNYVASAAITWRRRQCARPSCSRSSRSTSASRSTPNGNWRCSRSRSLRSRAANGAAARGRW
jgi:dolichol-phosphate mannosyltransferase